MKKRRQKNITEKVKFILGIIIFLLAASYVGKQDLEEKLASCAIYQNCSITPNEALSLLK